MGGIEVRVRRGFRLMAADLRALPGAGRRRVAAYRAKPRKPLFETGNLESVLALLVPVMCMAGAARFLVEGTWWQRLLALPLAALGTLLLTLVVWCVRRPVAPREPGWFEVWWRSHHPDGN